MQPLTDPPPIEPKCLSSIESLSRYLVEHVDAIHQPTDDGHRVEDLPNPTEPALRLNAVTRLRNTSSSTASAHVHADDGLVVLLNRLPAEHTGPLTGQLNLILGESLRAKKRLLLSHGTAQYVRVVEELDGGGDLEEKQQPQSLHHISLLRKLRRTYQMFPWWDGRRNRLLRWRFVSVPAHVDLDREINLVG